MNAHLLQVRAELDEAMIGILRALDRRLVLSYDSPVYEAGGPFEQAMDRVRDKMDSGVNGYDFVSALMSSYPQVIRDWCEPGQHAEASFVATNDMLLVGLCYSRAKFGIDVAKAKLEEDPSIRECVDDEDALFSRIIAEDREARVISRARELAGGYEVNPDAAEEFFRWAIDQTADLEFHYLRSRPWEQ